MAQNYPPAPPDPAEYQRLLLANARAQARLTHPEANAEVLDQLTDPGQIDAVAGATHEAVLAGRQQARSGAPVAPANSATAAPTEYENQIRKWQGQARWRSPRAGFGPRTMMDPGEADQARMEFMKISWNNHMAHRKRGHGDVSEPPPFQAPSQQAPAIPPPGQAF